MTTLIATCGASLSDLGLPGQLKDVAIRFGVIMIRWRNYTIL